jgi:hypothetical protein
MATSSSTTTLVPVSLVGPAQAMKWSPPLVLKREQGTPALSTQTPPVFLGPRFLGKAQHLPTAAFAPVILVSPMVVLKTSTNTRIELFINLGPEA